MNSSSLKPMILMYHRVADLDCDPWQLAVTPGNFVEQMEVLRAGRSVVPLEWLVRQLNDGTAPQGTVSLTFDDGYVDMHATATVVLARYDFPAMMFLPTGAIGNEDGFWWDILARIIFTAPSLPDDLTLETPGGDLHVAFGDAEGAAQEQATPRYATRAELHLAIWHFLKHLEVNARRKSVNALAAWAGVDSLPRDADRTLSHAELHEIVQSGLWSIGAHTVTHPSLPQLSAVDRNWEVVESRRACEELAGGEVRGFSYPFGDVDQSTVACVEAAGFAFACTTVGGALTPASDVLKLPRVTVGDWGAGAFEEHLSGVI